MMWEVVRCYEIGNRMLNHVGSRILLRSWKSYVARCGMCYFVTKLKIVCCTMWDVVCCYEIEDRMLDDVGCGMLLRFFQMLKPTCW